MCVYFKDVNQKETFDNLVTKKASKYFHIAPVTSCFIYHIQHQLYMISQTTLRSMNSFLLCWWLHYHHCHFGF